MTIVLHLRNSIRALACFVAHGTGLVAQQDDRLCKSSDLGEVAMNGGRLAETVEDTQSMEVSETKGVRIMRPAKLFFYECCLQLYRYIL